MAASDNEIKMYNEKALKTTGLSNKDLMGELIERELNLPVVMISEHEMYVPSKIVTGKVYGKDALFVYLTKLKTHKETPIKNENLSAKLQEWADMTGSDLLQSIALKKAKVLKKKTS